MPKLTINSKCFDRFLVLGYKTIVDISILDEKMLEIQFSSIFENWLVCIRAKYKMSCIFRTISDSRLYESASQPRQVPVPGIPFRPSASEYGPGPAPKLSFKAKSTHAHPGRPIHLLAGELKTVHGMY